MAKNQKFNAIRRRRLFLKNLAIGFVMKSLTLDLSNLKSQKDFDFVQTTLPGRRQVAL